MQKILSLLLLLLLSVPVVAQDDDATIADIIQQSEDHRTLTLALETSNLLPVLADPDETFTVFAPTDAAFDALLETTGLSAADLLTEESLEDILTFHVVTETLTADDLSTPTRQTLDSLLGDPIITRVTERGLVIADTALVTTADLTATNGVVHVIDAVLIPTGDTQLEGLLQVMQQDTDPEIMAPVPVVDPDSEVEVAGDIEVNTASLSILHVAEAEGNFTTLLTALDATGLTETLDGDGPFTVFAPTDAAFNALATTFGLEVEDLLHVRGINRILTYHVLLGTYTTDDLSELERIESVMGSDVRIQVTDDGLLLNGAVRITSADIPTRNGIIHVINAVLLPTP